MTKLWKENTDMIKKVIILLFLAISFVLMTLISYMKFQTVHQFGVASQHYQDYSVLAPAEPYSAYSQNQSEGF